MPSEAVQLGFRVQELQRAIDLEPQNSSAHLDLGQLYPASGRASEAKDEAKLILQSMGSSGISKGHCAKHLMP